MGREESELYGLPLEEFIPARTELEKRLRKEGERERAAAVKKLPKPSVAAWGVNQASRSQSQARRDLLEASAELGEVQERLIAREASAADLEQAAARQRAAIDSLVDAAAGLLTGDGKSLGDTTLARIRETFAAVASDPELAELVEAGTVDRERRPSGLGFAGVFGGSEEDEEPAAKPARAKGRKASRKTEKAPKESETTAKRRASEDKQRAKEAKRRERELKAAGETVKSAKAEEKEAARRRKAAERDARKAAEELERAERAATKARERAESAREELEAATAVAIEAAEAREAAESELDRLA